MFFTGTSYCSIHDKALSIGQLTPCIVSRLYMRLGVTCSTKLLHLYDAGAGISQLQHHQT